MGSPSATLNLPPHLLPWYQAGVRYFLGCKAVAAPEARPSAEAVPQAVSNDPQVCWPAPWDRCWAKTPRTARMVWTYLELGRDLCGKASPDRGHLFRSLLGHLGWPKGTTAFWPLCCPGEGGLLTRPDLFWEGCKALGVKHVACFGADALALIEPGADAAEPQAQHGAITIHVLPAPADLLKLLPHDQHFAGDRLKVLRF